LLVVLTFLHDQVVDLKFSGCSLNNLFFNGALSNKSVNYYLLLLTYPVCSVNRLQVNLGVPVAVKNYYDVSRMQVDSKATCSS